MLKWLIAVLTVIVISIWSVAVWLFLTADSDIKMVHEHSQSTHQLQLDTSDNAIEQFVFHQQQLRIQQANQQSPPLQRYGITRQWIGSITNQREVSIDFLLYSLNMENDSE
ncbi:MAG: hypothetical protein H0Z32_08545 [Bacillaceae bacterium]|nr:hypothetical protein [Bacillaceae bacterium]